MAQPGSTDASDFSPFDRVVCGIDGSDEGLEAARQAGRLARESLTLVAVIDPWDVVMAGGASERPGSSSGPAAVTGLRAGVAAALETARARIEARCPVESKLVEAQPADALLREAESSRATLLAVGTHGCGRLAGIALGSVATAVTHRAPCSVLVARPPRSSGGFPVAVVVGVDGSDGSVLACQAARELRRELGATVRMVAGTSGIDLDAARSVAAPDPLETTDDGALAALLAAAQNADLIVVGSRGLHGVRTLGSVGERAVHAAPCSVLVVRSPGGDSAGRRARGTPVRELMTAPAVVAPEETPLDEVARLLLEHEIGAVPIVSAEGQVVGIVSESDFAGREVVLAASRYGHELKLPRVLGQLLALGDGLEEIYEGSRSLAAREVMSAPVHVASEDEPVQQALTRMLHHDIDHMPVVRGGVPVGMLSRHDLIRLALRTWEGESD